MSQKRPTFSKCQKVMEKSITGNPPLSLPVGNLMRWFILRQKEPSKDFSGTWKIESTILLTGSAGTGKSYLAAYYASKLLRVNTLDKVYLVRSICHDRKTVDLLPSTIR